jgi:hypothetical protein
MPDYSMPPDDRPDDMAELARLTAIELRKRGIWAYTDPKDESNGPYVWSLRFKGIPGRSKAQWCWSSMLWPQFDNLGPIGCADVIQAEEARKAQEWAGDE